MCILAHAPQPPINSERKHTRKDYARIPTGALIAISLRLCSPPEFPFPFPTSTSRRSLSVTSRPPSSAHSSAFRTSPRPISTLRVMRIPRPSPRSSSAAAVWKPCSPSRARSRSCETSHASMPYRMSAAVAGSVVSNNARVCALSSCASIPHAPRATSATYGCEV